ncbi:unnamed protein product [Dracunculus medinensis]|uniref:DDHD domain-containing protein n=1 Tax=Dracunculus medinensis TaxID=318479 RepID=A0A0N4U3D8_DRAME|nr:unnamed protein product [Dracunculus medinensis]
MFTTSIIRSKAYRLEPLIHPQYRFIRPIKIFSSCDLRAMKDYDSLMPEIFKSYIRKMKAKEKNEKDRINKVQNDDKEQEDLDDEDECDSDESSIIRPTSSSPRSITPPPLDPGDQRKSWWKFGGAKKDGSELLKENEEIKMSDTQKIIEEIPLSSRLQYRLDYQLQPQITDRSYWSVLKSHSAYWANPDIASFIVNRFPDEFCWHIQNVPNKERRLMKIMKIRIANFNKTDLEESISEANAILSYHNFFETKNKIKTSLKHLSGKKLPFYKDLYINFKIVSLMI